MIAELHQTPLDYVISITIAVLGPLVVGLVIWRLGLTNEDKRVKGDAIRDLMTYRGDYSSPEFRRALNKVSITFHQDASIRKQIRELYETINNPSNLDETINRKIVGVIYSLCQKNGYTQITEYDIDQSFPETKQTPQGAPEETIEVPRQDVPFGEKVSIPSKVSKVGISKATPAKPKATKPKK